MKMILNRYLRIVAIVFCTLIMISGCNSNGSSSIGGNGVDKTSAYFGGKDLSNKSNVALDIKWTVDGFDFGDGPSKNTPFLFDMSWHILTLTVQNQPTPLESAVAINGIQWKIIPAPTDQRGESVQIMDINCRAAKFSKNGDTCSAYVRIYYDYQRTGIANPPTIYAQFATYAYPGLQNTYNINVEPLLDRMQGEYRVVQPIENIGGPTVLSNPGQYQILQMQNTSLPYIIVTQVTPLTNPNFNLIHRTINGNDPYYGLESECSPIANPALVQINKLNSLNDTCILIYQASASTTQTIESDYVTLASTAAITFPWSNNTFELLANYATGHPIPESDKFGSTFTITSGTQAHSEGTDMVMDGFGDLLSGTIVTPYPFNLVDVNYDFSAGNQLKADSNHSFYNNYQFNLAENCTQTGSGEICTAPVQVGSQLLTDASSTNPVTVSQINEGVQDAASNPGTGKSVAACGGALTRASGLLKASASLAKNNTIHLTTYILSHALCGSTDNKTVDADIPLYGYNNVIYNVDQVGCGGGNWDIGGKVTVTGPGCNVSGNQCVYSLIIEAWHGGTPGQCQDHQQVQADLTFDKPQIYAQVGLSNFTPISNSPSYLAVGGQNLSAWYGGQGAILAQTVTCDRNSSLAKCHINGVYQNGTSASYMTYQTGNLQPHDRLHQGQVNFNRSDGYDLNNFVASHKSQENIIEKQ